MPVEQNRDKWSIIERPRQWHAFITRQTVIVRHDATDLADGEDEYPPTYELTWEEWKQSHTGYGLDITGAQITAVAERKSAWRKIRRMANGDAPFDETNVRDAFGAVRRILRDLINEVND
jgi:hypothetical protein